jgi:hypothetical protein
MATMKKRCLFFIVCLTLPCLVVAAPGMSLDAQAPGDVLEVQSEGALGTTKAGMTIEVQQNKITGGHYFVANDLRDIPITGNIQSGRIVISGADGSSFDLRFKGNGSEHGKTLNFDNSVGLIGTRLSNGKVEKIDLGFLTMGQPSSEGRRYAFTTDLSDSEFESIVREWRLAVLSGNRKEAAKRTHFPLRVNARRKHRTIRTSAELFSQWDDIFTPVYLLRIKKDLPHDMLGESSSLMVMLGAGDVWFDDKGIEVINLPD